MARIGARLRYFAEETLEDWRRSPGANVLATATLAGVLFVAGLLVLGFQNVATRVESWRSDARVEVYLHDDASSEIVETVRDRLVAISGVERVDYVTKEEALRRFREGFPDLGGVPDELGENPFPASLEAVLAPGPVSGATARAIASGLAGMAGVEDVRWDREWLDRADGLLAVVRRGGAGTGLLVLGALMAVMAGILRLTVHARRDEIEIMRLVGASTILVRGPFLVAGAVQGTAAAVVAWVLVEGSRRVVLANAGGSARGIVSLIVGTPLGLGAAALLIGAGFAVGGAAAWLAVRSQKSNTM